MTRRRRWLALILLIAGLGAVAYVVASVDHAELGRAISAGGWALLPVAIYRFAPLAADTMAWRLVMLRSSTVSFGRLLAFRWIGESINNLLPVAQVGGVFVRARLLAATGYGAAAAGASVLADFILGLLAQVIFTLAGLAALAGLVGWSRDFANIALMVVVGAALIVVFILIQRGGSIGRLAGWMKRWGLTGSIALGAGLAELEEQLRRAYARRGSIVGGTIWRLIGWCLHAGEVWLILYFTGYSVGFAEAVVLESMGSAARSAAFIIPAGVGAQEAGIVAIALMLGLPAEVGLALALIRRGREVLTSVPGLLVWGVAERRGLARVIAGDAGDGRKG